MTTTTLTPQQQFTQELKTLDAQLIGRKKDFEDCLPASCKFEMFIRVIKTAIVQTPDLMKADRASLLLSCVKAAQDGLLPNGREAALVPYKTKQKDGSYKLFVQYMPMIGGVLKKVRNSGELANILPAIVYENDKFNYSLGYKSNIKHKPNLINPGNPIAVYAIAKMKDGSIYSEVMGVSEIEKIRNISKARDSIAWKEHWGEMAKKTVIRRLSKLLPMSTEVEQVIQRDDEMFDFSNTTLSKPVNSTIEALNRQIVGTEVTSLTDIQETEQKEEIIISPEIEKKAQEIFMDSPENG